MFLLGMTGVDNRLGISGGLAQSRRQSSRAAFSLLEMLITFALILIMMVLLYGSGSRTRQNQQKKTCQKNLLKLHIALEIFADEHDGGFPILPGAHTAEEPLELLVPQYTADTSLFICPGSKDSSLP